MKKFIVSVIVLLIFMICSSFGRIIYIEKVSEGSKPSVEEKHEDATGDMQSKSTLICIAHGQHKCSFSFDPSTFPDMKGPNKSNPEWKDLEAYAENEIAKDMLSGSFENNINLNEDFWSRSVEWEATDKDNYKITITIEIAKQP